MSSSESEDDLVTYGTPLEPLEEDEIPKKRPCSVEDQVVKDKQGRRRFHGAFTGGFSAGFFNTVGSLEGWTPSSFKSSKSNKKEILHQKPEDFMDEEDVSEFGISPVMLKARRDYVTGDKRKLPQLTNVSLLGSYVLKNLLQPVRETLGIKLLKKMGWKPGQGVGAHQRKSEKKRALKIRQKMYGCMLPPGALGENEESISDSDSEWDDIEFAPNDYEPSLNQIRNNFNGIGYKGLDKRPILGSSVKGGFHPEEKSQNLRFGSQAFGVGAFEEEDDDIYSKDDMSHYDFSLGNDQLNLNEALEKSSSGLNGALEGFVAEKKRMIKKHYQLPVLPKDFKPHHKWHVSRFDQLPPEKEKLLKPPKLSSDDRRLIVGEISEEQFERKKREEKLTKELISNVKITSSKFKPFSTNPEKQTRYENYLKLIQIGKKECLKDLQPFTMSDWDKEREKVEFEKAAMLFKPLTGAMEERFSTASQPDDLSDPLAVVEKFQCENDDRRKAAKMNMFGSLTRKTENWIPCQLLCKRFNIPEPRKNDVPQVSDVKAKRKAFDLFDAIPTQEEKAKNPAPDETPFVRASIEQSVGDVKSSELNEKNLDEVRDKIDIFRAIFLASDDEDAEEERMEPRCGETETKNIEGNELLYEEKVINSRRNLSPPSGLFENINLESLVRKKANADKDFDERVNLVKNVEEQKSSGTRTSSDLIYGPKIPDKMPHKASSNSVQLKLDDDDWVEKKTNNKKHKKNKKNKKSSHKPKHKHKKHKR